MKKFIFLCMVLFYGGNDATIKELKI